MSLSLPHHPLCTVSALLAVHLPRDITSYRLSYLAPSPFPQSDTPFLVCSFSIVFHLDLIVDTCGCSGHRRLISYRPRLCAGRPEMPLPLMPVSLHASGSAEHASESTRLCEYWRQEYLSCRCVSMACTAAKTNYLCFIARRDHHLCGLTCFTEF